jgi:hypothetical protein
MQTKHKQSSENDPDPVYYKRIPITLFSPGRTKIRIWTAYHMNRKNGGHIVYRQLIVNLYVLQISTLKRKQKILTLQYK